MKPISTTQILKKLCVAAALLTTETAIAADRTAPPSPTSDFICTFRHPIREVGSVPEMPASIAKRVETRLGDLAARGAYYHHTDVFEKGDEGPAHRFIRAGHFGGQWFLAFESGGYAYEKTLVFFALSSTYATPKVLLHFSYYSMNLCEAVDSTLAGKVPLSRSGSGRLAAWAICGGMTQFTFFLQCNTNIPASAKGL